MRRFQRGEVIKEGMELGVILAGGEVTYDVIWIGGSTSRYRYDVRRDVRLATTFDLEGQDRTVEILRAEAAAARQERRSGARIRRGQVHPSRR